MSVRTLELDLFLWRWSQTVNTTEHQSSLATSLKTASWGAFPLCVIVKRSNQDAPTHTDAQTGFNSVEVAWARWRWLTSSYEPTHPRPEARPKPCGCFHISTCVHLRDRQVTFELVSDLLVVRRVGPSWGVCSQPCPSSGVCSSLL